MREMFAWDAPRASAGGMVLLGAGMLLGATGADLIHRYAMTYAANLSPAATPTRDASITTVAQFNQAALGAKPNMWSIGLQLLLGALGIAGGAFAPWGAVKMFSYGVGLGAVGHLGVQLINAYLIEPMMGVGTATVTPTGARLFAFENIAVPAINPPSTATTTAAGLIGQPDRTSAVAAAAPAGQPRDRQPSSLGQPAPVTNVATPARPPVYTQVPTQGNTRKPGNYVPPPGTQTNTPANPPGTQTNTPAAPPQSLLPLTPGGALPPQGPPGGGGGGGGTKTSCTSCGGCGPDCNCQPTSLYGAPPPRVAAPHPLIAALRAA